MRRQLREKFYQGLKTLELLIAVAIVIIIICNTIVTQVTKDRKGV